MYQYWFINYNKCAILVGDVGNGGGSACVGADDIQEISVPSPQSCCESKTAPKKINSAHPKEFKAEIQTGICSPTITAALFIIPKRWKQIKCPSKEEWTNKMWYIHTKEIIGLKE